MALAEAIRDVLECDIPAAFERFGKTLDPQWIDTALVVTGTATLRRRRVTAQTVVWLVIGMALFRDRAIAEVIVPTPTKTARRRGCPGPHVGVPVRIPTRTDPAGGAAGGRRGWRAWVSSGSALTVPGGLDPRGRELHVLRAPTGRGRRRGHGRPKQSRHARGRRPNE